MRPTPLALTESEVALTRVWLTLGPPLPTRTLLRSRPSGGGAFACHVRGSARAGAPVLIFGVLRGWMARR